MHCYWSIDHRSIGLKRVAIQPVGNEAWLCFDEVVTSQHIRSVYCNLNTFHAVTTKDDTLDRVERPIRTPLYCGAVIFQYEFRCTNVLIFCCRRFNIRCCSTLRRSTVNPCRSSTTPPKRSYLVRRHRT